MRNRLALGLAIALGGIVLASASPKEDSLTVLEQNPSSTATEQIASIYRHAKDPDARLWLMDVLYARVRQYNDAGAMELLWKASRDQDADVRRKAINNLDAFRFLPGTRDQEIWAQRVQSVIKASGKDPSPAVRLVGRELEATTQKWQAEKERIQPAPPEPKHSKFPFRLAALTFVWAVSFQLLGYVWCKMGLSLLAHSKAAERAIAKSFNEFKKTPSLSIFPLLTVALLLPLLSLSLGWRLVIAATSWSSPETGGLRGAFESLGMLYLMSGMACFLPAALMTGRIVGGMSKSINRVFGIFILGIAGLIWWPVEAVGRLAGLRPRAKEALFWMAEAGTPFAILLACAVMVKDGLPPWTALREAARRFAGAREEPGAELWGRAPFQPSFLLWSAASPVLFSFSLIPALALGFHPGQIFNLWFLSNIQFAICFGWWAGIVMSIISLSQLTALGGIRAAQMALESTAATNIHPGGRGK